jgi:hypothetical protein
MSVFCTRETVTTKMYKSGVSDANLSDPLIAALSNYNPEFTLQTL